jgi:hypothetical protein
MGSRRCTQIGDLDLACVDKTKEADGGSTKVSSVYENQLLQRIVQCLDASLLGWM